MVAAARRHQEGLRILIADGDADTRALRALAGEVIDAADGRTALVSALTHRALAGDH